MEILIISPILLFAATLSVVAYKRKHKRNKQTATSETKSYQPPEFKPYGTERTVDGQKYKYHDGFWFLQFPFDDEISLELCVGNDYYWITLIEPELSRVSCSDENALYAAAAYPVQREIAVDVCGDIIRCDDVQIKRMELLAERAEMERRTSRESACRIRDIDFELTQNCCIQQINIDALKNQIATQQQNMQINAQIIQALRPIPMPYYQYPPYHPPFIPQGGYCASQYPYAYSPWGCRSSW